MIAVGGTRVSSVTTRSYDNDGTSQWTADHGYTVYCVAADSDGNVYTGGDSILADSYNTTRKYNSSGTLQWSASHGSGVTVYGIAVDGSGNVYAAGTRTSSKTTRKYNSSGTLQWSRDYHGTLVYCIAVDSSGNVYVAGSSTGEYTTRKYNSSGTLQWSANHGATVLCIAVDSDGNVYTGGLLTGGYTTRKYDSSGTLQWSVNHGDTVNGIAVDSSGNVYTTGTRTSSKTTRKYNSSGSIQWSVDFGYMTEGVAVDNNGNVYVAGVGGMQKFNSSGTYQWAVDTDNNWRSIAWAQAAVVTAIPALALALALALPSAGGTVGIPPLAVPLALAIPLPSEPPLSPELAGLPVAKVYRAYLAGTDGTLLKLPITSLQCTRRAGDSTWLAIPLSTYTAGWWAAIQARIGNEVVINSGYRLADGSETTGLFLRATLTAAEYEYTRDGASITLTARVIPTASTPQSRTLYGIRSQTQDNGRYTVICEPDPLIRPGDTVAADGASFVVHSAQYRISPQDGEMTVVEVA